MILIPSSTLVFSSVTRHVLAEMRNQWETHITDLTPVSSAGLEDIILLFDRFAVFHIFLKM